jgi:alpha-beta hydrolase superfamily lysophospholipase
MVQSDVTFSSLDGTMLVGTLLRPPGATRSAVLVHGGGVARDEAGFYVRLANALADDGVASLRFDLRGHGASGGRQQELTLASVANDIRAALEFFHEPAALIGASFSGGACALVAARALLPSLVLLNPLLDYKQRFVDEKPYWHDDRLDAGDGGVPAALAHFQAGSGAAQRGVPSGRPSRPGPG